MIEKMITGYSGWLEWEEDLIPWDRDMIFNIKAVYKTFSFSLGCIVIQINVMWNTYWMTFCCILTVITANYITDKYFELPILCRNLAGGSDISGTRSESNETHG